MQLIDNAGSLWHKLWSMRLVAASTVLSAVAAGMGMFETKNWYVVAAAIVANLLAMWARMVAQPKAYGSQEPDAS